MARLKGKWKFNKNIVLPANLGEAFAVCAYDWGDQHYLSNGEANMTNGIRFTSEGLYEGTGNSIYQDGEWQVYYEFWSIVDFGEYEIVVSNKFYDVFTANATQLPSETVIVTYGGTTVASLKAGQMATIKCEGATIEHDIILTAPQKSPLPIEVASEAEMAERLERSEIGSIFKYIGPTGTYENSALYIVEESEWYG